MRKVPVIFFILFYSSLLSQAQTFEYTANCKQAYQSIFKLKLNEGLLLLAKERKENPKNYLPFFIENYADFLKLYVNDNEKLYTGTQTKFASRLEMLSKGNKNSPYYLYTQADIHLQSSLCKIKFGDYLSAVFEVKKAYTMLQENNKKYPDFKPNLKSLGLLHTIFGAVPDKFKFGAKLLGLNGSIDQGLKELNTVLKDDNFQFKEETIIMYTLLMLHLQKDKTTAWSIIESTDVPLGDNLLNYFIAATVAKHTGKNDKVISILSNKPNSNEYYPFPFLDFLYGDAKLNKLDSNADVYIKKFLADNKGRSYQKEALRKLAWFYLIHENPSMYKKNMQQILTLKDAPSDEDKSAQKEAQQNYIPNKELLKARILFDGGYFDKALTVMNAVKPAVLTDARSKVEYYYRYARIYHELGEENNAVKFYLLTIQKGQLYDYYFAANSCIKLANIFELQNKKNNAILYYQKAMNLDKDEYNNSINAEAKAGLNRLGA